LSRILVVEDEPLVREALSRALSQHEVVEIASLALFPANLKLSDDSLDLVLLDLKSSHDPEAVLTLRALPQFRCRFPRAEIWVQSGSDDLGLMRACIRAGAQRFLLKEHLFSELPLVLGSLEERVERREKLAQVLIGSSPLTRRLREDLVSLATGELDVLIEGESGSGKELCAAALAESLVAVNIAALPAELFEAELFGYEKGAFSGAHAAKEGFFEAAAGGALFLDEIQSLKPELQVKLLRVLETRKYRRLGSTRERDFTGRLICAANVTLSEKVARGEFREDLYHRIAPITVRVPPLRLRKEDVRELARVFLAEHDVKSQRRWDEDALVFMENYDWPGNVRELKGLVRSLCARVPYPVLGRAEVEAHLSRWEKSEEASPALSEVFRVDLSEGLDANLAKLEEWMLRKTLESVSGIEAQERLGLKRSRYYERLKHYGLIKETEDQ
jgi:DNA-binding NtrC family response regulator